MNEKSKSLDSIALLSEAQRAKIARELFVNVSMKYPASITAQASGVAETSLKSGFTDPTVLGNSLISSESEISTVIRAAQLAHRNAQKGPTPLDREETKGIISSVYAFASRMMVLGVDNLHHLQEYWYPQLAQREGSFAQFTKSPEDILKAESLFQDSVYEHINEFYRKEAEQLGLPSPRNWVPISSDVIPLFQNS